MQILNFAFRFISQLLNCPASARRLQGGAGKAALMATFALHAGLLATSPAAMASATFDPQGQSSAAALDIRVVIPAILRVLEDSHPHSLVREHGQSTTISALQRMVLISTLGKGFCMNLQLSRGQVTDWQLRLSGSPGTWIKPSGTGYQLCAGRSGRYEIALQHEFNVKHEPADAQGGVMGWPVSTSLSAP